MWTTPDHLLVLHAVGNVFQEDFFYHLPKDDLCIVPCVSSCPSWRQK